MLPTQQLYNHYYVHGNLQRVSIGHSQRYNELRLPLEYIWRKHVLLRSNEQKVPVLIMYISWVIDTDCTNHILNYRNHADQRYSYGLVCTFFFRYSLPKNYGSNTVQPSLQSTRLYFFITDDLQHGNFYIDQIHVLDSLPWTVHRLVYTA